MSYEQYPYLVLDTQSRRFKSEPVVGYFTTRQAAQDNATRRNHQLADAYGMTRYVVVVMDSSTEGEAQP